MRLSVEDCTRRSRATGTAICVKNLIVIMFKSLKYNKTT
ncbi:unnamed protein product [Brassica napus]|uniref:(rape) hypothetical protein n=1 Tax=Brassica napus TaxID=3708 RepID=A0A816UV09_BRANA|nr:unnamed protein product [Brassica napus]